MPGLDISADDARRYAELLALARVGIGALALVAPDRVTDPWVGRSADPRTRAVLARALGARDLALGLGTLRAARRRSQVRAWVEAGALADSGDVLATLIGFRRLPWTGRYGVLAIAAAAVVGAGLVAPRLRDGG